MVPKAAEPSFNNIGKLNFTLWQVMFAEFVALCTLVGPELKHGAYSIQRWWNKGPNSEFVNSMDETFPQRLLDLQKDPTYFDPQQLKKLKIVFDRVCDEIGIVDIRTDQRQRDKLATIVLVGSRLYADEDELVKAAIKAMHLPGHWQ